MPKTRAAALLVLAGLAAAACHSKGSTVLVVTVSLSGSLPPVAGLDVTVVAPTITDDKIARIDVIADPARLGELHLAVLDG